jgi:hypothetical protein
MAKEKRVIDWEGIEREYRAGIKTHREIAAQFEVSHKAIQNKAAALGWTRNLAAKIKAKAFDKVAKKEVAKKVAKITETDIIESEANLQATVLLNERNDIKRLSGLSEKFECELESSKEDLEKKARIMKSLTDTRKTIIELRRRNYNINDNANGNADESTKTITRIELIGVASIHVCS